MSPSRPGVLLVLHLALGLADALQDDLLGRLRGDAAEVGRRVVPLADDVAVFVELLRDHADLAGLDVDLDERFLGGFGHALVRGDERVRQRLQHDLFGDALLDRERRERFEHLGIFHALRSLARPRFFFLARSCGCGPHSNTVCALVIAS